MNKLAHAKRCKLFKSLLGNIINKYPEKENCELLKFNSFHIFHEFETFFKVA